MADQDAAEINEEIRLMQEAGETALQHALRAGELLNQKKDSLKHGEFIPWVKENVKCEVRHAQNFMKLSKNATRCAFDPATSIRAALKQIAEPKPEKPKEPEGRTFEQIQKLVERAHAGDEGSPIAQAKLEKEDPAKVQLAEGMWRRAQPDYLPEDLDQLVAGLDEYHLRVALRAVLAGNDKAQSKIRTMKDEGQLD